MDKQGSDGPLSKPAPTIAQVIRDRVADSGDRVFLRCDDRSWTYGEAYQEACRFACLFLKLRDTQRPFHVGVLMDNLPEFIFTELGCALANAVLVGLNPTRTGSSLGRDVTHADCQIIVVEQHYTDQLGNALKGEGDPELTILVTGEAPGSGRDGSSQPPHPVPREAGDPQLRRHLRWSRLEEEIETIASVDPRVSVEPTDLLMIIFTSGTTRAPKGVLNSHGRMMMAGWAAAIQMCKFTPEDVIYAAMPLFHANAQILGVVAALSAGGGIVLSRKFSKSNFLGDIRRYGATLFNYVGNPMAYIMDTPEQPDDADNPLRLACGNEAPRQYIDAFSKRFGCEVIDGYGASEVGVGFSRQPGDPPRSLGRADNVKILNENDQECEPARLTADGRLLNPDQAVGEIVNTGGSLLFEGYYKDEEATRERTRKGRFHTGDLGYRDADGFIYFAGRDAEWLRVGGENFLAGPIEEILCRSPDVMLASVYGVPDPEAGDQVMVTIKLREGATFDAVAFGEFLDGTTDLPPRWRPTFVRVAPEIVVTHTNKVLRRVLRQQKFLIDRIPDPVYWRPRGATEFRRFTAHDLAALRERFERAGHADRLGE